MGLALAPKTRKPTAAPPNPTTRALRAYEAVAPWFGGTADLPEVEGEAAGGRVAAAHVGCCVLWLCFVLWLAIEY